MVQKDEKRNRKMINVQNFLYVYPLFCPRSYEHGLVHGVGILAEGGYGVGRVETVQIRVRFWSRVVQIDRNRF